MFKKVKDLQGGYTSHVELVTYNEELYVLRTATIEEVRNERFFHQQLAKHNIPTLAVYDVDGLSKNQILLEYVPDSPTLEDYVNCDTDIQKSCLLIEHWGNLMAHVHSIRFDQIMYIKEEQDLFVSWGEFIDNEISYGLERQRIRQTGLSKEFLTKIINFLQPLKDLIPKDYSLVHCDPHENNILIRGNDLVLFDKGSDVVSSDPLFDIIVVAIEFIGAFDDFEDLGNSCDSAYWQAFLKGYGPQIIDDTFRFDLFFVLRCLTRHPNPFTPYLDQVMLRIIDKYT